MSRVLLINPSYAPSYGSAKAAITNPIAPTLGLATIAGTAMQRGHEVSILDLSWRPYDPRMIRDEIRAYRPDIVGVTATTPLMNQMRDISVLVKDISRDITVVAGGPHPSALPLETMRESRLDMVFVGEADYSFAEICDGGPLDQIGGLFYRDGDQIIDTGPRAPIYNLDDLPMPAWELYDPADYMRISRLLCKRPPIAMAEFSRGCVFKCNFCASKITMALGYRKKSPERCAEEVAKIRSLGFREFMLADDIFTSDQAWATEVSDAIACRKLDISWTCSNGIRVESANDALFQAMSRAGCYRVSFGFETGNAEVLKSFGKGGKATLEQGEVAVRKAKAAGIDTTGFFLLGLSHDTEDSMEDTIEYARTLPLDMLKFGITIAFPGTPMFSDYSAKKMVRSFNWDDYFIYTDQPLFAHEHLSYEAIQTVMGKAYKRAILHNPGFMLRRLWRGVRTGELFWDAYYALKFFTLPATSAKVETDYYAKDRWPIYAFADTALTAPTYQVVRKIKADGVAPVSIKKYSNA